MAIDSRPRRVTELNRWRGRAMLFEAMTLLTATSAAQRWVPMARWSRVLGTPRAVPSEWNDKPIDQLTTEAASVTEYRVVIAITRGAHLLPWKPSCLAEAAAGQVMLARRGEPGVVIVGLRPTADDVWAAHAWLLGRVGALTGGPAAAGFSATTVFARANSPH